MKMDDGRWVGLEGGYRVAFDPRPLLVHLRLAPEDAGLWGELIENLYHQGDVGVASYAAIPVMVSFAVELEQIPWQMLALVPFIEMARVDGKNPPVPEWLAEEHGAALSTLAEECMKRLPEVEVVEVARGMLCMIALWKGFPVFARAVGDYTEEELAEILPG
jgi:hypothetical protein